VAQLALPLSSCAGRLISHDGLRAVRSEIDSAGLNFFAPQFLNFRSHNQTIDPDPAGEVRRELSSSRAALKDRTRAIEHIGTPERARRAAGFGSPLRLRGAGSRWAREYGRERPAEERSRRERLAEERPSEPMATRPLSTPLKV
jgi:hypothetical protein